MSQASLICFTRHVDYDTRRDTSAQKYLTHNLEKTGMLTGCGRIAKKTSKEL